MANKVQIVGGAFQDSEGNVLANGTLTMQLNQDAVATGTAQVGAGVVLRIPLDEDGNIQGTTSGDPVEVWPNDALVPTGTYYTVFAYSEQLQEVWGPFYGQVLSTPDPFDVTVWIPAGTAGSTVTSAPVLQTNGVTNDDQAVLDVEDSDTITFEYLGNGQITAHGSAAVTPTADYFIGGNGTSIIQTIGTPVALQPVTGIVTTKFVAVVKFFLEAQVTVHKVTMGTTSFDSGTAGAVGIYDTSGNLVFQIKLTSTGTVAPFVTNITGAPVVLPAGTYYFAWSADSTVFGVRGWTLDNVTNSLMNADATDLKVAYATNLFSGGNLPATLGTLSAVTLNSSTTADSVPFAIFS